MARPKIRRLLIVLAALGLLVVGYAYGFVSHRSGLPPYGTVTRLVRAIRHWQAAGQTGIQPGQFFEAREGADDPLAEQLARIGYLAGYEPVGESSGVTVHVPDAVAPGLNLYNSGHAPEAFLMTSAGDVVHRWRQDFWSAFPDAPRSEVGPPHGWWRRAFLKPDGHLLAIFEGLGLIELDRDSNLVWSRFGGYHHHLTFDADGNIHVLWRTPRSLPDLNRGKPVLEDFIVVLAPDGTELRRTSLLEAIRGSIYAPLLGHSRESWDVLHTNTIEFLDGLPGAGREPFTAGRVLLSFRNIDTVGVLDEKSGALVWALTGPFGGQHDAKLLDDGNLLLFDNYGSRAGSRVLEVDPFTQRVAWQYGGKDRSVLDSTTLGTCQRLANGNTLITESEKGRAIEVTPDRRIVWEFLNPERAGEEGELIATLFEVHRVDAPWALPQRETPQAPAGTDPATGATDEHAPGAPDAG